MKSDSKVSKKRKFLWIIIAVCFILMLAIEIFLIVSIISLTSICDFKRPYIPLNDSLLVPDNETSNLSICSNYSVSKTSYCLNKLFKEIYVYNITEDYSYDNFSTVDRYIRQYGGDCHESAMWFAKAGAELGFNTKYLDFTLRYDNTTEPNTRYLHAIAVIADEDIYCLMDQGKTINCYEFKTKNNGDDNATR